MENLTVVEEEMFRFLRHSFQVTRQELKQELEKFLHKIKQFEKSRFETRAFAYLDIISWVEGKVYNKPMSEIIAGKYRKSRRSKEGPQTTDHGPQTTDKRSQIIGEANKEETRNTRIKG